ncbi:MAG TPA: Hpt domain-containing protein, partial [bacterium]|nr:Hpt domain-containing protein [bacterium]
DRTKALQRAADDQDLLREIMKVFVEDAPRQLREIHEAFDSQDAEEVRKKSHALRGAAGNVSAVALQMKAQEIEQQSLQASFDQIEPQIQSLDGLFEQFKQSLIQHGDI